MGIIELIKDRRSIREYVNDRDINYEDILEIIEAARWAPSSGNLQNWYFIIIKDKEKIKQIAIAAKQEFIKDSAAVIIVCSDDKLVENIYGNRGKMYAIQNVAASIQNMLLVATEKGIGTCWIGAFDEEKVREIASIPNNINIHAIITLGYYNNKPPAPERKPLEDIVFFEKWGNKKYKAPLYPIIDRIKSELDKITRLKA